MNERRRRGTGTIRYDARLGCYRARMPGNGEWMPACETYAEAAAKLDAVLGLVEAGNAIRVGDDTLVGWAWAPGFGREPAPGTQKEAGALVEAWVKTGAACPD